jgi:multiple sugar transport system ATP-binding protein
MGAVRLVGITKGWAGVKAVDDLSLSMEKGEFITLLGPSGCGKTTTLRMIAGLEDPDDGDIYIDGRIVFSAGKGINVPPSQRGLGMIFQSYALWPHMTVFDNVAFGLVQQKAPRDQIRARVMGSLEQVELAPLAQRFPSELSGGQQQRVAVARMVVVSPELLLMDEPLSNLDTRLRMQMRASLKRMHQESGTTVIYVTHDQEEALTLSTRIAVMNKGKLEQYESPEYVYDRPASQFVAEFTGNPQTNLIEARAAQGAVSSEVGTDLEVAGRIVGRAVGSGFRETVVLAARPEALLLCDQDGPGRIPATVYATLPVGSSVLVYARIGGSGAGASETVIRAGRGVRVEANQGVWLQLDWSQVNMYDADTGRRLDNAVRP